MTMHFKKLSSIFLVTAFIFMFVVTMSQPAAATSRNNTAIGIFDFRDAPLGDVLKVFTEMTKKNVVATPEILDLEVSLYLEAVDPLKALETLCKNYNLWYAVDGNIIRVMKVEEYGRELVLRRDEKTEIYPLKYASCLSVAEMIACVFGSRIQYNEPDAVESYGHVGTDELPEIGKEMEVDGADDKDDEKIRKRRENVFDAGGVELDETDLKKALTKSGKVSLEELINLQIGQAQAMLTVFPRNNAIVVRSIDIRLLNDITALISRVDTPTRQVLLEVKILEMDLGDGLDSFFNISVTPGGEIDDDGSIVRDTDGITGIDFLNAASLTTNSFDFAYINKQVQLKMELLENENRIKTIATPLMLCANNAASKFFQGVKSPVRKGYTVTQAKYGDDDKLLTPETVSTDYEEEEVGVTLEISPSINMDRTVTLKIAAEIATINSGGGPPFAYTIGGVQQEGETDTISETTIEDIVVAMDNQSVALGGLIQEEDVDMEKKVPLLGDIPLLGFFFKSKTISKSRSEIVFLIEPHIIMSPAESGEVSRRFMGETSGHPYYREGTERLLELNKEKNVIESLSPVEGNKSIKRIDP